MLDPFLTELQNISGEFSAYWPGRACLWRQAFR